MWIIIQRIYRIYSIIFSIEIYPQINFFIKWKKVNSNLCDLCTIQVDRIEHAIWDCLLVKGFWFELFKLWNNINEKTFNPTLKSITFGAMNDGCDDVNILILWGKKFIQYCKKINKSLSPAEFIVYLSANLLKVHPDTENIVNLIRIAFPDFEIAH